LIRVKGDTCYYRAEGFVGNEIELRMMWRYMGKWKLEKGDKPPRRRAVQEIHWEEIVELAPEPGSQV